MKMGIGQDSHKFLTEMSEKVCVIGGVSFPDPPGLDADSDGDVVYHAICNAITSVTHVDIMGDIAIKLCKQGITDSQTYLTHAKETLGPYKIAHIAIAVEGKRPRMQSSFEAIRKNVAHLLEIDVSSVGITCTSGNSLDDCGRGIGIKCICLITII